MCATVWNQYSIGFHSFHYISPPRESIPLTFYEVSLLKIILRIRASRFCQYFFSQVPIEIMSFPGLFANDKYPTEQYLLCIKQKQIVSYGDRNARVFQEPHARLSPSTSVCLLWPFFLTVFTTLLRTAGILACKGSGDCRTLFSLFNSFSISLREQE